VLKKVFVHNRNVIYIEGQTYGPKFVLKIFYVVRQRPDVFENRTNTLDDQIPDVVGSHLLGVRKTTRICVRHLVESEQE
jgi:hypothetical protein